VLASITISPATPTVANGTAQTFTKAGADALGHACTVGAGTWASSDATDFPITSGGVCTPNVNSGSSVIQFTETASGISGTTTITATTASAAPPTFTSITPNTINQNTSGSYSIVGTGLNGSDFLSSLPAGVSASGWTASSSTAATVTLTATPSATLGATSIKITDPVNGTSGAQTLTVNAGTPNGTARSSFLIESTAASTHPSAAQSAAIPATFGASINGTIAWKGLGFAMGGTGGTFAYVQATKGSPQANVYFGHISPALSEQIIPAGTYTIKCNLYVEGATTWYLSPVVYIWRPSTGAVVGWLRDSATALSTVANTSNSANGKVMTFNLATGFAIQLNDVMIVEMYAVGGANDFVHFGYDGNGVITENGTGEQSEIDFPTSIYTAPAPIGIVRVGPSGIASSIGSARITPITVASTSDSEWRSKMVPSGAGTLWDSTATSKNGTATGSPLDTSSFKYNDLAVVDGILQFTDRDSVARNTLQVSIKPAGGAPLSSANDSLAVSSSAPEARYALPSGSEFTNWYVRQLVRFTPGIRLDAPNNTTSNTSGFNLNQTPAYKVGPHPSNNSYRADFEITSSVGAGAGNLTGGFSSPAGLNVSASALVPAGNHAGDTAYIVGSMSTLMPNWNTGGDVWEIVRVQRIINSTQARQAVYIGKVTDVTLTKVSDVVFDLDTTKVSAWIPDNEVGIIGKNFNRQLAATDTTPVINFSDVEFADITETGFTWPTQIASGDRI